MDGMESNGMDGRIKLQREEEDMTTSWGREEWKEEEKGRKEEKLLPENDVEDVPTGNPVAITVIAISPFILSSTNAPNMMLALGSTAS